MPTTVFENHYFFGEDELAILRIGCQEPVELHTHPFHELVLVFSGSGIHYSETSAYEIAGGDVFVLPPGINHGYRATKDLDLVNVLYWRERLPLPLGDLRELPGYHALFELEPRLRQQHEFASRLRLEPDELSLAESQVRHINRELVERVPGYRAQAAARFLLLAGDLSRAFNRTQSKPTAGILRIGFLLSHLEAHYAEPITLHEMAEMALMSASSLNRLFRRVEGVPPVDYLLRLRLHRAAEILRTTDLRVTEVALSTGFSDANYFSRQFRRFFGANPRAYRDSAFRGREL